MWQGRATEQLVWLRPCGLHLRMSFCHSGSAVCPALRPRFTWRPLHGLPAPRPARARPIGCASAYRAPRHWPNSDIRSPNPAHPSPRPPPNPPAGQSRPTPTPTPAPYASLYCNWILRTPILCSIIPYNVKFIIQHLEVHLTCYPKPLCYHS